MEQENKPALEQVKSFYWLDLKRFILIGIFLLIMFFGFLTFFYLKADEITKDPCLICAEYMGDKVICRVGTTYILERIYNPNGTITDNSQDILEQIDKEESKKQFGNTNISDLNISVVN